MYEQFLNAFTFLTTDTPYCAIELTQEPFCGVRLYIGQQFVFSDVDTDNKVQFTYDIFEHPDGFTEEHVTPEFDDLISGIFLALLEKHTNK